jgi:type IV secretory pathway VirB9-like protein
MRAGWFLLLGLLAAGGCADGGPPECKGPVWSANPSLPTPAIWDNGVKTFIQFPPNSRIPAPYVVNPDNHAAIADYTFNSRTHVMTIHDVAKEIRLIDGDSKACFTNRHWLHDVPASPPVDTGTTSPFVVRMVRR